MKNLKTLTVGLIIIISLIFSGCNSSGNKKETGKEVIKFGAILTLTGDAASYGEMMKNGMDIALEEINKNDSIHFDIKYENSEFKQTQAVSAAKKLIEVDKVSIITGITGSKNAKAICPLAIQNNTIIIDALSSAAELSNLGGGNYFRLMPSDNFAGAEIAKWASELNFKRGFIFYANDDWGNGIKKATEEMFKSVDNNIINAESINTGESQFRNILLKCKTANPDVIFLLCYAPEASKIVKQAKELGIKATFIGSDNLSASEFVNVGISTIEGILFVLPSDGSGETYEKFREKYKAKYNQYPSVNSIKSYDVIKLAAYVISKVGTDPEKIKKFLRYNLDSYYGASGKIEFSENGDIKNPEYQRMIYNNGSYTGYINKNLQK